MAHFPGLPGSAGTRKVKPIWILLKQETVSGSGISWAICRSATRSRQITTPAPHHSVFFTGQMPFLSPNQQCQNTEGATYKSRSCKSNQVVVSQISTLSNQIFFSQIKSPHVIQSWFKSNHDLFAHYWFSPVQCHVSACVGCHLVSDGLSQGTALLKQLDRWSWF